MKATQTKENYLETISEIFETLKDAVEKYNAKEISQKEMQDIVRKAWDDKPKGFMLVDDNLAECFGDEELHNMVGKVVETEPYVGPSEDAFQEDLIDELIEGIPSASQCSMCVEGSASFIQQVIGAAEWEYCLGR